MPRSSMSKAWMSGLLVFIILLADQLLKIWVKTHMHLNEDIPVLGNWFMLRFIENNGMAFGMEFGGETGKLILSIFRIIAIGAIVWYLVSLIRKNEPIGLIIIISLVLSGALGNLIDSAFYGMIFSDSGYHPSLVASIFPAEGGYESFLHGRVVDMFYVELINTNLPQWVPFWGGEDFIFFRPIFNIADSAISIGVILILIFQKRYFK